MGDNEGVVHFRVVRFIYEAGMYHRKVLTGVKIHYDRSILQICVM